MFLYLSLGHQDLERRLEKAKVVSIKVITWIYFLITGGGDQGNYNTQYRLILRPCRLQPSYARSSQ